MMMHAQIDGTEGWLVVLGLKLVNVVVGAITSFVALRFFKDLNLFERWTTFLGGWAIAAWGGAPLTEVMELSPKVEIGIVILCGLFGMAVAAQIIKVLKDTDWPGLVKVVLDTILRRKSGGDQGQGDKK